MISRIKLTETYNILDEIGTLYCYIKKVEKSFEVCKGAVNEMGPIILQSLYEHYTDPDFICPLLKLCEPDYVDIDVPALIADIIKDTPE
jgi:sphingomyelin phosphodiesterase